MKYAELTSHCSPNGRPSSAGTAHGLQHFCAAALTRPVPDKYALATDEQTNERTNRRTSPLRKAAAVRRSLNNKQCGRMLPPASNHDFWPFDLETGMRVASKVGNLYSKFGHAMPLRSRIIRYERDRRTDRRRDGRTDRRTKATLIAAFPTVGGKLNDWRAMPSVASFDLSRRTSLFVPSRLLDRYL